MKARSNQYNKKEKLMISNLIQHMAETMYTQRKTYNWRKRLAKRGILDKKFYRVF